MTNQEIAEQTLNEMYTFIMSGISAASSTLGGKAGTTFSIWMGGVDGVKDIALHPSDNHYEAVGRTVGNMISVVTSFGAANVLKNYSIKVKAAGAFGTNEAIARTGLGDTFSNLFNTYVANADAFYTKILTDENYASKIWDGLTAGGLDDYMNFYNRNPSEVASDLVDGFKELFSSPPAYGTVEFEALYSSSNRSTIIIKTQDEEAQKVGIEAVVQYNNIKTLTLNNQTLDIATPTALQLRNALESISDYQFLLSNVLIKPDELLDMGEAGVITVKSGDTLSQLAVKYLGGNAVDATKKAVLLNPWLADLGRINFIADTNKILLESGASLEDTHTDHVYKNEESADFFYDANGGFDTYITGDQDTIKDSDGKGLVKFKDIDLTGTKVLKKDSTDVYVDQEDKKSPTPAFEYKQDDDTLIVTHIKSGESITILEWSEEKNLGITLQKSDDIDISVDDKSAWEEAQQMQVKVEILRELADDEVAEVEIGYYIPTYKIEYGPEVTVPAQEAYRTYDEYYQTWQYHPAQPAYTYRPSRNIKTGEEFVAVDSVTFTKADGQTQNFTYRWKDDKIVGVTGNRRKSAYNETDDRYDYNSPATLTLTAKTNEDDSSIAEDIKVTTIHKGVVTIKDNDEAQRTDPLVLDLNKDGFISTTALADSNTYFDITGDGLRERVGWVEGEDGLLVYDKNENGEIDGISELFGSKNESGIQELKRIADSNYDNTINQADELYNRLQVWRDKNQDAIVQENELSTLQEEGITSINLNAVNTKIEINGNTLTEASKYTDTNNNKELIADIQLATDAKDTKLSPGDIPNYTIDESTRTLPNIKGSGLVYDAFIRYNTDEAFKALAKNYANDKTLTLENFEPFVESYSGYTSFIDSLKERYSLEDSFDMQESDKKAWIVKRFEGESTQDIENYYTNNLDNNKLPSRPISSSATITNKYDRLKEQLQSTFAIQTFYKDEFAATHYDLESDSFIIDDAAAFNTTITEYFNSSQNSIQDKLLLARTIQRESFGLQADTKTILNAINNPITKEFVKDTLYQREVILGTQDDDVMQTTDSKSEILLAQGDDALQSGRGNNTFYFRRGDGSDTIQDAGGVDKLVFDTDINAEDVIVKLDNNQDLTIALKEGTTPYEELTDRVTFLNWINPNNRVEVIELGDGSRIRIKDILTQYSATDGVDNIAFSTSSDIIDAKGGDDIIKTLSGNDTITGGKGDDRLEGGVGNDTYIYNLGDGRDTIIDKAGHDTLQFASDVTQDMLTAKLKGADLFIGIKEEGKTFDELSDVITIKNYTNKNSTIEAVFLEGYKRVDIQTLLNQPTEDGDSLELGDGDDIVNMLGGNDTVKTNKGNDTITGGSGSDTLEGGLGDDTYIFNLGDGKDTIFDDYSFGYKGLRKENAGNDTLQLGEGITQDMLIIKYNGPDLLIGIKEADKPLEELSDVITIKNYTNKNNSIENILLSDGSSVAVAPLTNGTDGNDTLEFGDSTENLSIAGLNGNDFIHTVSGDDNVEGGKGLDTIYAGAGSDILSGGAGSDFLAGGSGDDTYIYNRGDGADMILDDNRPEIQNFGSQSLSHVNELLTRMDNSDTAQEDGGNDTLRFGAGITREDISYKISEDDLIINIAGASGDVITIKNYLNSKNMIENMVLDDGTVFDLFGATEGDDDLVFGDKDITIDALGGNDIVSTSAGDDIITGGKGNDTLKGGSGDDTYIFSRGDGQDRISDEAGSDTVAFTAGITQNDLIVKLVGRDLILAFKEDGKSFDELSDKITFVNHTNTTNKLETIAFSDGSTIDMSGFDYGTEGDDLFVFGESDIDVNGYGGDDTITTGSGNDTITGGTGSDILAGGSGDDTYLFDRGDGKDSINDTNGIDKVVFGADITQDDIVLKLIGRDLVIALKEDGKSFDELSDKITFLDHTNNANRLESIAFNDGSSIDVASIDFATEGDDTFMFGSANTTLDALGGNDIVTTSAGNDILSGGSGDDILRSGAGEDTLQGGLGSDTLEGGRDNDTYLFGRGDGIDTIHDYYHGYDYQNGILEFDKDPSSGKMVVKLTGDNLINALKSRERQFSKFAKNSSNSNASSGIFMKLIGDDLVVAQFDNGKFEGAANKIVFHKSVSDNGLMEFTQGEIYGDIGMDIIKGDLLVESVQHGEVTFAQNANAGNDTLIFGEGITQEDIIYKSIGSDLVFALKEGNKSFEELSDKIVIKNYVSSANKIENVLFSDGSRFDFDARPSATEGDDNFVFDNNDTTIDALGGDDIVTTGSGNDNITGGTGNDILSGGAGNDTYYFSRGDGRDRLFDAAGNDTIAFGDGIAQSDLLFQQNGSDLTIALKEDGKTFSDLSDTILIKDWFTKQNNIETIALSDGSTMVASKIAGMLLGTQTDRLVGNQGATMLGGAGDDTYVYNKGDFTVIIDDKFQNREIEINAGNDTLEFADITKDKVTLGTQGSDLIIKIDATHDTYTKLKDYVVVRDWKNPNRGIEQILFADGEVLPLDKAASYPPLEFDENWIDGNYYIYGSEDNIVQPSAEDLALRANADEIFQSGAGDDTVNAYGGNDYIIGGTGDDILNGGSGNDTYLFNIGDGKDTITDTQGVDAVKFGAGISKSDVTMQQVGNDLLLSLNSEDQLLLKNWFDPQTIENRIELMITNDDGVIAIADIVTAPTQADDTLEYGDENNHIEALDGDDIIHIGGGDDYLAGDGGNDMLYGEDGNDTLSGDSGEDILYGAEGDDTYLFGRGDGKDTIIEDNFEDWSRTGNDTLKFKAGVSASDLILVEEGDDLLVGLREDGKTFSELSDVIRLKKWAIYDEANASDYARAYYTVENFSFNDGSTWNMADIVAHIGSDVDETIFGFNTNDTLEGKKGNDLLEGHLGDDTYIFNRGDGKDVIYDYGRKGDDYSYYDAGNDTLKFGEGITADELIFAKSNDDVIVYIKDGDKKLTELEDKIVLKNWFKSNNRVENIVLSDGTAVDYVQYLEVEPTPGDDKLIYGYGDDVVDALAGDDVVVAIGGNNYIDGNGGNDNIQTGSGSDTLIGGEGDDTLNGGAGDDTLDGGIGSDTYLFKLGDGHDTVNDYADNAAGIDKIIFGQGIAADAIEFLRLNSDDLTIKIDDDNSIVVQNWFLDENYKLESFIFSDGTTLDVDAIESRTLYYGDEDANEMHVTKNAEKVFALAGDDIVYGNSGDDVVTAGEGNDTVYGVQGDDKLYGNQGNDTLWGGTGNDYLEGGEGNDTYIFNRGDGVDTVVKLEGNDSLHFGSGITAQDLIIESDGDNLIVALKEDGVAFADLSDKVILTNWYNTSTRLESFSFEDDVNATMNVAAIVSAMGSDENDTIRGTELSDALNGHAGDDKLYGNEGNDTLWGGTGNDYLEGGAGNDTYIFNRGDGVDTVSDNDSTIGDYYGGRGALYNQDTIRFGDNIVVADLIVHKDGDNLIIGLKEDGVDLQDLENKLIIQNYNLDQNTIESFEFKDGSVLTLDDIVLLANSDAGNIIYGTSGNDYLEGTIGSDTLYGEDGDDTLVGHAGNDRLEGGYGNDTYVFNRGDGQDTIFDEGSYGDYYGGKGTVSDAQPQVALTSVAVEDTSTIFQDTLQFGNGIVRDDLEFQRVGTDLVINVVDTSKDSQRVASLAVAVEEPSLQSDDTVTIQNYFSYNNTIETIKLSDGSFITQEDIINATGNVIIGTDGDDNLDANDYDVVKDTLLIGLNGNDSLRGSFGNDVLVGGLGSDTLAGGDGNDIYLFNRGDGQDTIFDSGRGTDTISFGEGITIDDIVIGRSYARSELGEPIIALKENSDADISQYHDSMTIQTTETGTSITTLQFSDGSSYNIADQFGKNWDSELYASPIVLDINGNGITSVALEDSNAYFDYDGDGLREHTAWVEKGDALLVTDLNGDGIINDGSEQFGQYTKMSDGSPATDGYTALSQYDTDGDGVIDKNDSNFNDLLLWKDKNVNGKSDSGELMSLRLSGITAIHLNRESGVTFESYFENDNLITNETAFEKVTTTGIVRDVWFKYDKNDALFGENDIYRFNLGDGKQLIDDNDLGSNGVDKLIFGAGISKDQIVMKWERGSDDLIVGVRQNTNDSTPLSELPDQIHIKNWFNDKGCIENITFADGSELSREAVYAQLLARKEQGELTLRVLDSGSELSGGQFNDILYGATGDELLSGKNGNDYLKGLEGDDYLDGADGNDVLDGGSGDDYLVGGDGDDVYVYKQGDGRDLISDYNGKDTIIFGEGITYDDLSLREQDQDLVIEFQYDSNLANENRDSILIENYKDKSFKIENIIFNDGNSFGIEEIIKRKSNHAPVDLSTDELYTLEDVRAFNAQLTIGDADGDKLYYRVSQDPQHGTLLVDANGVWDYQVEGTYIGTDSAVITIDDGYGGTVTKTLNFDAKVSAPTIETTTINLKEDNQASDSVKVLNPVGGALTYEILSSAANGSFSVDENGAYTYNPNQDYNGSDSVTLKVTNEYGLATTSTITLDIEAVNDAPVANEDSATTSENTILTLKIDDILANDTDVDKNDTMSLTDITTPANKGTVTFDTTSGNIVFEPGSDFDHLAEGASEEVLLTYTIADAAGVESTSTIRLTITGSNDAPVIESITPINVHEDDAVVTGVITSKDADDNATALFTTTATVAGFTLNADGSYSFNPADTAYQSLAKDEVQTITIPVTVTDDQGAQDTKELTLSVVGTNDIPTVTVETQALSLQNIRNIDGTTVASDVDSSDVLSYSVTTQAQHGVVSIDANGKWHYKAEGSFNGEDSATVLVDDGNGGTVTQTLNFTVDGYIYEGEDLIIDEASGNDTLSMTNINKEQLSFSRADDNLLIAVDDGGVITLKNYFTNTQAGVETLHTAQGDINLSRDVINDVESHWWHGSFRAKDDQDHLISGTDNINSLEGNTGNDIILGNNKYDWLKGNAGDDLLVGGDANDRLYGNEGSDNLYGDAGNDYLDGGEGNDALIGGAGRDRLYGDVGDDYLAGGADNDRLDGDKGNDTLIGGRGDDYLEGYYGSDTYIFNQGDGHDTIDEWSKKGSSDVDRLQFGAGITQDDVTIKRERYDAIFELDAENSVRVKDWFDDDNRSVIEKIQFTDGTQLLASDVNDLAIVEGNNHNNRLYGMDKLNDNLFGLGGNDRLYGYEGDDFLSGGSGKDRLYGDQGADTLIGGAGNDYLDGYYGSDTYEFAKGDGHDTIDEWSKKGSSDVDTIKFAEGITQNDVSFTMQHGDMFIQYATDDLIKVQDADDTRGQIEKVELSNGLYVTNDDINLIIQQINAYGAEKGMDHISNNDIQNNPDLMNIVSSAWHE